MTTSAPEAPVSGRHRSSAWVHMPGLDGVRAVAVAAVVVFHMDESWLPGGFLGVDVFFTLSGFLITSLLLAELDASNKVDFKRFYIRRARRLLPALYLVLVATAIAAMTVAQDAASRVREDAVAAFFYVTNWWYVLGETSYFEATGRPPMLQHLWSLAVEEQFYFVWPVLCWLLWKVGRTRGIRVGAIVGALASTVVMAWISIAQGMPEAADPSRVYFGSDTHAMTLLVGAALATFWRPGALAARLTGARCQHGDRLGLRGPRRPVRDLLVRGVGQRAALPRRLPGDRARHRGGGGVRSRHRLGLRRDDVAPAAALDRGTVVRHLPLALARLHAAATGHRPRRRRPAGAVHAPRPHPGHRRAVVPLRRDADPPRAHRPRLGALEGGRRLRARRPLGRRPRDLGRRGARARLRPGQRRTSPPSRTRSVACRGSATRTSRRCPPRLPPPRPARCRPARARPSLRSRPARPSSRRARTRTASA